MSHHHFIACDDCGEEDTAEWNGEHWMPPKGWAIVCDHEFGTKEIHMHLCPTCLEELRTKNEQAVDKKEG